MNDQPQTLAEVARKASDQAALYRQNLRFLAELAEREKRWWERKARYQQTVQSLIWARQAVAESEQESQHLTTLVDDVGSMLGEFDNASANPRAILDGLRQYKNTFDHVSTLAGRINTKIATARAHGTAGLEGIPSAEDFTIFADKALAAGFSMVAAATNVSSALAEEQHEVQGGGR